ncbi:hypothetical protein Desdi_2957 [Desulfitobacterium dichloroeliminans LMG P-21439]|uniref:Uncharacterized protein n=1 Tax=Desulfitobacterium dichloroeliminans (strain LMG P-21439 / DCA1) TaxID=871963 RepID=L0FBF9_DESDL|nr:hypothetical protein Desdi_2957 [Desulfitobacterium dichloroeliminans LMG P-21439]
MFLLQKQNSRPRSILLQGREYSSRGSTLLDPAPGSAFIKMHSKCPDSLTRLVSTFPKLSLGIHKSSSYHRTIDSIWK